MLRYCRSLSPACQAGAKQSCVYQYLTVSTFEVESLSEEPKPFAGAVAMWPKHCGPKVLRKLFTLQTSFLVEDERVTAIVG